MTEDKQAIESAHVGELPGEAPVIGRKRVSEINIAGSLAGPEPGMFRIQYHVRPDGFGLEHARGFDFMVKAEPEESLAALLACAKATIVKRETPTADGRGKFEVIFDD